LILFIEIYAKCFGDQEYRNTVLAWKIMENIEEVTFKQIIKEWVASEREYFIFSFTAVNGA
jgi:hypothetical protein